MSDAKGDPEKQVDYDATGIYDDTDVLRAALRYDRKSSTFRGRVTFADLHELIIPSDSPIYEHSVGVWLRSGRYDLGYVITRTRWSRGDSATIVAGDNADIPCSGDRFSISEQRDVITFSVPRSCLKTMGAKTRFMVSSTGYRAYMDANPEPVYYDGTKMSPTFAAR